MGPPDRRAGPCEEEEICPDRLCRTLLIASHVSSVGAFGITLKHLARL